MLEANFIAHHITPNTPEWLDWRRNHIGASDAPAIVTDASGAPLSPWATPRDVWAVKHGHVEQEHSKGLGHHFEAACLDWAADELAHLGTVEPGQVVTSTEHDWAAASLDGLLRGHDGHLRGVVEAKTDQHFYETTDAASAYGAPGTGDVPHYIFAQCQWQLMVTGLPVAYVPLFRFRDRSFSMYVVERDDDFTAAIFAIVSAWRTKYLLGDDVPPATDHPSNGDHTRYLRDKAAAQEDLNEEQADDRISDLLAEYLACSAAEKEAKTRKGVIRDLVMEAHPAATKIRGATATGGISRGKNVSFRVNANKKA